MAANSLMLSDATINTADAAPEWFNAALSAAPTSQYCQSDGVRLHYLSWGDDGSNKPALLFVHGFLGHAHWWAFIAPLFCQRYRVYALDFSGMGDSDRRHYYHNDTHGNDILALIQHLGLESVNVVAHSFGGGRVLRAAQQRPALFDHIIAVDSHLSFTGDVISLADAPEVKSRTYVDLDQAVARFRLRPPQTEAEAYVIAYIARHSLRQDAGQWTWKFDPTIAVEQFLSYDADTVLAGVSCKVDYIYGEKSRVVSEARAQKIYRHLAVPGRLVAVPEGRHHLMVSQPVVLISVLRALL